MTSVRFFLFPSGPIIDGAGIAQLPFHIASVTNKNAITTGYCGYPCQGQCAIVCHPAVGCEKNALRGAGWHIR